MREGRAVASVIATILLAVAGGLAGAGHVLAASHDIAIVDFEYEPAALTVLTGEPVTWTNASTRDHTVTSDQGTELDGNPIQPGEAYGHVFETAGTFAYHCEIHPDQMKGTITVEAAPATSIPSGSPEPTPPSGTLPPNFSPNPVVPEPSPSAVVAPTTSANPGNGSSSGSSSPQFLVLAFIGAALIGVLTWVLIRRSRSASR
jgi:plastocyanin